MWRKNQAELVEETLGLETPAVIFNTILTPAIHDAAREIRLEVRAGKPFIDPPGFDRMLGVSYLLDDEWRETMSMSADLQPRLFAHIRKRARMDETQNVGEFDLPLRDEVSGATMLFFRVTVEIASDDEAIHLHLYGRDVCGTALVGTREYSRRARGESHVAQKAT